MTPAASAPTAPLHDSSAHGPSGPRAGDCMVLAHLSDPHVPNRLGGRPHAMINKRVIGYLSWRLRRVRIHRAEVLAALARDLAAADVDHIVVTGDIVNISLPSEFTRTAEWLRSLGTPANVTVVPGNHDAYVAMTWERSWAAWQAFMRGDGDGEQEGGPRRDDFPIVRRRGPLALIGLCTAVPTAPGRSSGTVGDRQLDGLDAALRGAAQDGLFRVVLLHHPPGDHATPRSKRLTDAADFRSVIAAAGAEMILHGHEHRFRVGELPGPEGSAPVFGVPSASMLPHANGAVAQFHLHRIAPCPRGWSIETRVCAFRPGPVESERGRTRHIHGTFIESERQIRDLVRSHHPTPPPDLAPVSSPNSTATDSV
ncbi:MAG: metallophosphoesterase [Rhodospirillales bacterium]|nr:metallophosphoesterase [Rhodospirillales bacterium]